MGFDPLELLAQAMASWELARSAGALDVLCRPEIQDGLRRLHESVVAQGPAVDWQAPILQHQLAVLQKVVSDPHVAKRLSGLMAQSAHVRVLSNPERVVKLAVISFIDERIDQLLRTPPTDPAGLADVFLEFSERP